MHLIEGLIHRKQVSPQSQETVANINRYLKTRRLFQETAESIARRRHGLTQEPPDVEAIARGLEDIYRRRQKSADTVETNSRHWPGGHEEDYLEQTIIHLTPELERIEQAHQPEKVTRLKVLTTTLLTAQELPKLTPEQQAHVLSLGGRSREELIQDVKKIGISATIAGVLTPTVTSIIGLGSIALEAYAPFLHLLSNVPIPLAVGLSYALQYGTLWLDAIQNARLMRDDRYGVTPSVFATGAGYVRKAISPNNQEAQDNAAKIGTFLPALSQEVIFGLLSATPLATVVIARNIAATVGVNLPLVGVSEFLLRRKHKENKP